MNDTFILFINHNQAELFLEYLNIKHPNIKFTIETETIKTLPFLDTLITRKNNIFTSNTSCKSRFTGSGPNFELRPYVVQHKHHKSFNLLCI